MPPKIGSLLPMWDSSDPLRRPAPLPMNPHPGSPRVDPTPGPGQLQQQQQQQQQTSSPNSSREVSPVRRPREDSVSGPPAHNSPTRGAATNQVLVHRRMNSLQPSPSVREMGSLIVNGGLKEATSNRNSTPTPKQLFGSSTSFPSRDPVSNALTLPPQYRGIDFDKPPPLYHSPRQIKSPDNIPEVTNHTAPATYSTHANRKSTPSPPPLPPSVPPPPVFPSLTNPGLTKPNFSRDEESPRITIHDLDTVTSQLSGLTSIANSLQREMANLSRRSKDNATDLISIKEATKSRDEDIRLSLRELVASLPILEQAAHIPLITAGSSSSGRSSYGGSDDFMNSSARFSPGSRPAHTESKPGVDMQVLERILKEMSTKEDQERVIDLLRDIQSTIRVEARAEAEARSEPGPKQSDNEEKILSLLEELKDKEDAKGKELTIPGKLRGQDEDERIISLLEDIREDLRDSISRESCERIFSLLEDLSEGGGNERIESLLQDLKEKEGDERIDRVLSILEDLNEKEGDNKVFTMLEEVKARMDSITEEVARCLGAVVLKNTNIETGQRAIEGPSPTDEVLGVLRSVQEGVDSGGELGKEVKRLLEEWKEEWKEELGGKTWTEKGSGGATLDEGEHVTGNDNQKKAGEALKDLVKEIEVLVAEQRAAIARLPVSSGLPSMALTAAPLPPDLDNEAAITALANIASTTTRTDITLSSINALIKNFQKENSGVNATNTETLITVGKYLDELGDTTNATSAQMKDIEKVIEIVRTGVCGGNERQGESLKKIGELLELQKSVQEAILGDEDDLGVKTLLEELRKEVGELMSDNLDTLQESTDKGIGEIKKEIAQMANAEAIEQLKTLVASSTEKNIDAINSSNPTESIKEFRDEVKGMLEKSLALAETIDAKSGSDELKEILANMKTELGELMVNSVASISTDSSEVKSAIDDLRKEVEDMIEKTMTSAVTLSTSTSENRMTAAVEGLKTEVNDMMSKAVALADTTAKSEKVQKSVDELRKQVMDIMDKYNSAIAAPTVYPEAEEIKERIENLVKKITESMEKTAALSKESSTTAAEADEKVKEAIEGLRKDIGDIGKSITVAIESKSAASVEKAMKDAFDEMRKDVQEASDKSASSSIDAAQKMKKAVEELRKEVNETVEKSISMAIAINSKAEIDPVQEAIKDLQKEVAGMMEKSLVLHSDKDGVKEAIEILRKEVGEMMDKSMSMIVPAAKSGPDDVLVDLLEDMKKDIGEMLEKTPGASSDAVEKVVDKLRKEVAEVMEKTMTTITVSKPEPDTTKSTEKIEKIVSNLRKDIGEMVQQSLAAAIANSTFDSEEKVKDAIEELKGDVRDTLQMSMMPIPPKKDEAGEIVRVALEVVRKELVEMFDKNAAIHEAESGEVKDVIEGLKIQVLELGVKSKDEEVKAAVESLQKEMEGLIEKSGTSNGEVKIVFEDLKKEISNLVEKSADTDVKGAVEAMRKDVGGLVSKSDLNSDEVKTAIEGLKKEIAEMLERTTSALVSGKPDQDELIKDLVVEFRKEMTESMEKSLEAVKESNSSVVIEEMRKQVAEIAEKSNANNSLSDLTTGQAEASEAIAEISSAVEECRVEVAVVKTLLDEKHGEMQDGVAEIVAVIGKSNAEVKDGVSGVKTSIEGFQVSANKGLVGIKEIMEGSKAETKKGLEVVGKAVNGGQTEIKEAIANVDKKLEETQADAREGIQDIRQALEEARVEIKEGFTAAEEFQAESREDLLAVKILVEESHNTDTNEHRKTQKNVENVLGIVEGLQNEWKGNQPTLFSALEELKWLLKEAQTAANKPEPEPMPAPPAYDDSQTQEKLDRLMASNTTTAKYIPQLDLLDSIQKQVSATSADISEFMAMQKNTKVKAARQADLDLEKSKSEKALIEAATLALQEEHANLQETVEALKEETDELYSRRLRIRSELVGLETALDIRREELLLLEARAEGLERRVVEGVIEQSRALLMKPKSNSKLSKAEANAAMRKINKGPAVAKPKNNTPGSAANTRRNFSTSEIANASPSERASKKGGRQSLSGAGSLGLGSTNYSANLGLLKRSQSVKVPIGLDKRKGSWSHRMPNDGKENDRQVSVDDMVEDEGVDDVDIEVRRSSVVNEEEEEQDDEEESGFEGSRSSSGSVLRMADEVDYASDGSLRRKSKTYPSLGPNFSGGNIDGIRDISGLGAVE